MIRRSGVTLVEVLVSIFVMGIGLLALLALFPLGALSMAQAIKDARTAHAAANANAVAEVRALRQDPVLTAAFTNPVTAGAALPAPDPDGPSYPVYTDAV